MPIFFYLPPLEDGVVVVVDVIVVVVVVVVDAENERKNVLCVYLDSDPN